MIRAESLGNISLKIIKKKIPETIFLHLLIH